MLPAYNLWDLFPISKKRTNELVSFLYLSWAGDPDSFIFWRDSGKHRKKKQFDHSIGG